MNMFCPKCSEKLILTDFGLYCTKGDMYFLQHLAERLNECFILKNEKPEDLHFSFEIGGNWFCPKDRKKMIESAGYIKCPTCHLDLNEFISDLVEHHHHK